MRAVVQRVNEAKVIVDEKVVGAIGKGLLVLSVLERTIRRKTVNGSPRRYLDFGYSKMKKER